MKTAIRRTAANRRPRRSVCAITTTAAGIVTYRTRKPLTESHAFSFAKAVAANPRFLDATVTRSRKQNHFHVCFIPANLNRIEAMLKAEDNKDVAAAERDGARFVYREIRPGVFECVGITGTYEVSLQCGGSCTCPHWKYRRLKQGGTCKHQLELRRRQEAGLLEV